MAPAARAVQITKGGKLTDSFTSIVRMAAAVFRQALQQDLADQQNAAGTTARPAALASMGGAPAHSDFNKTENRLRLRIGANLANR